MGFDQYGGHGRDSSGNMPTPLAPEPVVRTPHSRSASGQSIGPTVTKRLCGLQLSENAILQSSRAFFLLSLDGLSLLRP